MGSQNNIPKIKYISAKLQLKDRHLAIKNTIIALISGLVGNQASQSLACKRLDNLKQIKIIKSKRIKQNQLIRLKIHITPIRV